MKKLLSLATLAAVLGATALPAGAVTVNTPNVTVKWNISVTATLAFNTDYAVSAGSTSQGVAVPTTAFGSLEGTTNATDCTFSAAGSANTVDFGNITPDAAKYLSCYYGNAADAMITTNSVSWNVTQALSASMPAGYALCVVPNGFTWGSTGVTSLPATASVATQTVANTDASAAGSCAAGTDAITTTPSTAVSSTAAFSTGQGAHLGEDYILVVPALAAKGAGVATMVYTVTAN